MDEVTNNVRDSGVKKLLYADNKGLVRDSREYVEIKYAQVVIKKVKKFLKSKGFFLDWLETILMKLLSLHAQFVEEKWETTPFYVSSIMNGCIKNALENKSALLR